MNGDMKPDTAIRLFLDTVAYGIGMNPGTPVMGNTALREEEWRALYRQAAKQGVLAVVYDVVSKLPEERRPPRSVNIQWALSTEAIENRSRAQYVLAGRLADIWNKAGIRVAVIKGMSLSRYYPVPKHRECGDFDCYLYGDYEKGNLIALENGAAVDTGWYKHSQINFHGLAVENHKFFVSLRGNKDKKSLERKLVNEINNGGSGTVVPGTNIIIPPVGFTALFMTYHSMAHFLNEGIRLRHVCDWACFVAAEQYNVDWPEFYRQCDRYNLRMFADAMTAISVNYLGLHVTNRDITAESPHADRILESILNDDALIYNTGKGKWWGRFKLLSNISRYRWKYRDIYRKSYTGQMARLVSGFISDRNPKV